MYADLHADTLYKCFIENKTLSDPSLHFNIKNAMKMQPVIETFAHYIPEDVTDKFGYLKAFVSNSIKLIEQNDDIVIFKDKSDLENSQTKILAVFSVEGGDLFTDDMSYNRMVIDYLKSYNIRFLSLCYNNGSKMCGGAHCDNDHTVTNMAIDVCHLLNENGIVIDVSHLNHISTKMILDAGVKTVATHSNSFSLCNNPRNISDDNIIKIIEQNGLIGVNLYSPFLKRKKATLDDVVKHITHIRNLGGKNSVALGTDFDGCDSFPNGIDGVGDMAKLYKIIPDPESVFYNNYKNYLLKI